MVRQGPHTARERERRAGDRPCRARKRDADDPEIVRAQAECQTRRRGRCSRGRRSSVEGGVRDPLRGPVDGQVDRPHLAADSPSARRQPARREHPRPPVVVGVQTPGRRRSGRGRGQGRARCRCPHAACSDDVQPPDDDEKNPTATVPEYHRTWCAVAATAAVERPPRARSGRRPGCACRRRRRRATSGGASRPRRSGRRRPGREAPGQPRGRASRSARRRAGSTRAARRRSSMSDEPDADHPQRSRASGRAPSRCRRCCRPGAPASRSAGPGPVRCFTTRALVAASTTRSRPEVPALDAVGARRKRLRRAAALVDDRDLRMRPRSSTTPGRSRAGCASAPSAGARDRVVPV